MFVTADQLFAHAIGDYVLQTNRMAQGKTKDFSLAALHGGCYTIPFLMCSPSFWALLVIVWSHAIIDHWSLGRKLKPMPATAPESLRIWLPIIVDNLLHVGINAAALKWL